MMENVGGRHVMNGSAGSQAKAGMEHSRFKREEDTEGERNHWRNGDKGSLFHVRALHSGIIIRQTFWYFIPLWLEVLGGFCGNPTEQ